MLRSRRTRGVHRRDEGDAAKVFNGDSWQVRGELEACSFETRKPLAEVREVKAAGRYGDNRTQLTDGGRVQQLWDEILDEMREANEVANLKGHPPPFRLENQPKLAVKRLIADTEAAFGYFLNNAFAHFCDMHRGGINRLPDRFRTGDLVYHRIRFLRNYQAHAPKEQAMILRFNHRIEHTSIR